MTSYWNHLVAGAFDRRDSHRPSDRATLRAAAVELHQRGLHARDIAAALRISDRAVLDLIGKRDITETTTK